MGRLCPSILPESLCSPMGPLGCRGVDWGLPAVHWPLSTCSHQCRRMTLPTPVGARAAASAPQGPEGKGRGSAFWVGCLEPPTPGSISVPRAYRALSLGFSLLGDVGGEGRGEARVPPFSSSWPPAPSHGAGPSRVAAPPSPGPCAPCPLPLQAPSASASPAPGHASC